MELRSIEKELNDLAFLYTKLERHVGEEQGRMPTLEWTPLNNASRGGEDPKDTAETTTENEPETFESWTLALEALESIQKQLDALQEGTDRLRKRSKAVDPISNQARYGAKTMARVVVVLKLYEQLQDNVDLLLGTGDQETTEAAQDASSVADRIRQHAATEQEEVERRQQELKEEEEREEAQRQEEIRQREREKQETEEAVRIEAERQQLLARQQVEQARLAQEREAELAAQADREWLASIPNKGQIDGVKQQLDILVENSDAGARRVALTALHTLLQQIVAHPEDPKLRRIRRDHAKFEQDVGRLQGGKEVLIAAGFSLNVVEEIPSLVLVEPDLERDFDRWSAWFDLLKASLGLVEQYMIKN